MRGTNSRILYDFLDASVSTSEWEIDLTVEELETPRISSDVLTYVPGNVDLSLNLSGYIEGISDGLEDALNSALDSGDRHVALILDHTSLPASAYVFVNAFASAETWAAAFDGLMTLNGTVRGRSGGVRGNCIYYNENTPTTGNEVGVQVTTIANANVGKAFLFLHGWTGSRSGNIVINVQSSPDNSTWTTIATFTMTEARSQVEPVTFTGGYIRVNVSSMGGTTNLNYSLIVSEN
jgi:hypothetical protein